MKKQTKHQRLNVVDRWTAAASGKVEARRLGKPKGELNQVIRMSADWSKIPNTLLEDATGQLWLAFTNERTGEEIDKDAGFEAVTVVEALEWIQTVSEFTDGHDGDITDVCRIALAELARRPTDLERVRRAVQEERKAGCKPRRSRAAKS